MVARSCCTATACRSLGQQGPPQRCGAHTPPQPAPPAADQGPQDTPFEGGTFELVINVPEQYPLVAPNVRYRTKIFHPNVHFKVRRTRTHVVLAEPAARQRQHPFSMSIPTLLWACARMQSQQPQPRLLTSQLHNTFTHPFAPPCPFAPWPVSPHFQRHLTPPHDTVRIDLITDGLRGGSCDRPWDGL